MIYPMLEVLSLMAAMMIAGLAEAALHYFPWRMLLGRPIRGPWSYVVGVAAFLGPYITLLVWWALFPPESGALVWALAGIIGVVAASGGAVIGAYWLDDYLLARRRTKELGEEIELLGEMVDSRIDQMKGGRDVRL